MQVAIDRYLLSFKSFAHFKYSELRWPLFAGSSR